MDKATLSDKDLDALLAWRDEHKDLVRSMPAPMKDIAIYLTDKSDVVLRSIRKSDSHLRIYMNTDGKPRGYVEYINRPPEGWFKTKDTLWRGPQYSRVPEELMKETAQSMFTVYASLMALMVYGNDPELSPPPPSTPVTQTRSPASPHTHTRSRAHARPRPRVTYILRMTPDGPRTAIQGSHSSPSGIFSVRGHYRHYKSGKVVWIAEYRKGEGKKKTKTYKLGGKHA